MPATDPATRAFEDRGCRTLWPALEWLAMTDRSHGPSAKPLGGRYEIIRQLGRGGMAEVFLARDLNLQRRVALKLLREDYIHDPAFRTRFLGEARAAANLVHSNIVTVYDFGHHLDQYFIVMEYVDGTDLKTLLRRRGRLSVQEASDIMIQVCSGVGYAHRAGLVHCDLKPFNILITPDLRAKIADFGIARALASIDPGERSELVWGSPQYFAPEQASGAAPSPASDVYSLGVMYYEMLTGRLPFEAADPELLADMHVSAVPPNPQILNPEIPNAISRIMLKVLAKEPAARYRTADQLGQVLATFSPPEPDRLSAGHPSAQSEPRSAPESSTAPMPAASSEGLDWVAVGLGLIAFLLAGGLVPLWLWACLLYPSCPIGLP